MNGTRIALVLGLAGLAGLGLATPGMLGAGAKPEACVPRPCAEPAGEADPVAADSTGCTMEAFEIVRPESLVPLAAPAAAVAEPSAQAPVPAAHKGRVLYPVERPAATSSAVPMKGATPVSKQSLQKQRVALGKKLAGGQSAGGKGLPVALGTCEADPTRPEKFDPAAAKCAEKIARQQGLLVRGGKTPDGSQAASKAAALVAPVEKLPQPK